MHHLIGDTVRLLLVYVSWRIDRQFCLNGRWRSKVYGDEIEIMSKTPSHCAGRPHCEFFGLGLQQSLYGLIADHALQVQQLDGRRGRPCRLLRLVRF